MRLGLKMALATLCVVSLLFGICGGILVSSSFQGSLAREKASVRDSYQALVDMLSVMGSLGEINTRSDITDMLAQLGLSGSGTWTSIKMTSDGSVIYDDGNSYLAQHATLASGEAPAFEPGHAELTVVGEEGEMRLIVVRGACSIGEKSVQLELTHDIAPLVAARDEQLSAFRLAFVILVASCAALTFVAAFALTRPLSKLSKAAHDIAGGNLSSRSEVRSDDEVGSLSKDFDLMAVQIEHSMEGMRDSLARQQRFMGSFAHEMKTPMTSVIGYADLMRKGSLSEDERARASEYIFDEGRRLEALSSKLLELFLLDGEAIDLDYVEVRPLVSGICGPLSTSWTQTNTRLQWRCDDGICEMDADLVGSLIVNLLENARRATDEREGGRVALSCTIKHGVCKIAVADNGSGISPEDVNRLTEEFYRVDKARSRAQGGAGIGLSLCAKIMEAHGGDLRIASRLGEGTCVTATFPGAES